MKTTPRTICSTIAAALAISMLAGACGDSSTDQTVVESDADTTTAIDDTTISASQAEETASASDSDNADQTSDSGSQATSETEEQASGSDDADASPSGSADDDDEAEENMAEEDMVEEDYEAEEDMVEEDYKAEEEMVEEDYEAASQPEVAGEDCDAVKDRNELRLGIEGPAAVIVNDVARPGDECDFHMLYIDGMSRGVNSNGIVQLSITCDNPDDVEVALSGPGGFDYRHGADNGRRYECGDTWTKSVNYQSDLVFFTVYIRPLRESGASSYQVVALPAPT
jgi:hypothetical protein